MESEVRPSENAAKKNKANDQKKNRTGRKTDSVLLHPMCRITLSSSGRVQAEQSLLDDTFVRLRPSLGLEPLL